MSNDRFYRAKGNENARDKSDDLDNLADQFAKFAVKSNSEEHKSYQHDHDREVQIHDGESGSSNGLKDQNHNHDQFRHQFRNSNRGNRGRGNRGQRGGRGRLQNNHIRQNDENSNNYRKPKNENWKNRIHNGQNSEESQQNENSHERNYENKTKQNKSVKMVKGRNTIEFKPSYAPPDLRLVPAPSTWTSYRRPYNHRDVVVVNGLFGDEEDMSIYKNLLHETQSSGIDQEKLWAHWHNESHWIADDKLNWKKKCPTFQKVLKKMSEYFKMDVKATRFNWYRNSSEWKPFHHDAAAVKADKAKTQNLTVAVSFGMEREAAFEHAKTKTTISVPQYNGTIYTFGKEVNVTWRHGIPAIHPSQFKEEGRISIIAWGWVDDMIED
ncbi:unnamed protein product [Oikopleura dioica]|uniref:Fe2OG dioxygenase domain-containing protein n=1 Tax=Oikopleura dioica TaxID=34765 RepID=E4XXJ0_OIKDI|nr:unnamed protein product [Oikopleura dioica]